MGMYSDAIVAMEIVIVIPGSENKHSCGFKVIGVQVWTNILLT